MRKSLIVGVLLTLINLTMSAQYYDPSTMMINQMFNQMNQQLADQANQYANALMDLYEKQQQQYDENSSATIYYLPGSESFYAFITYFGGSPVKIVYVSPMDTHKVLSPKEDYYFAQGSILVNYNLKPGSSLRVYNTGTGKLLAKKSIPTKASAEFASFSKETQTNCKRVANIIYGSALLSVGNANSNSSNGSVPSPRGKKVCSFCGGKGWYPACSSPTYSMGDRFCSECQRTVPSSHSHDSCPSCRGTGYMY